MANGQGGHHREPQLNGDTVAGMPTDLERWLAQGGQLTEAGWPPADLGWVAAKRSALDETGWPPDGDQPT